ncbi:hypothetical protein [Achromobacter insolitus]|uniref:hypothetical protein n=1 Tax=Achromobacter insolitus TaxID=217204 RepID=UPI002FE18DFA
MTDQTKTALLSKLRAPVADEPCKRCGGPGWYTSHTTGYPESIPCSACNPQGVSVERLAKDPFLAAQLWRKPAVVDGSLLERILEHVGEYGESMASSALLSIRSIARRNVETRIAAELAALASAPVAGEAQKPVAKVHRFTFTGMAHAGFFQEALLLDGAPPMPNGTLLYPEPQAIASVRIGRATTKGGRVQSYAFEQTDLPDGEHALTVGAPQASEAVRDGGAETSRIKSESRANSGDTVVLPPLPSPPEHRGHAMFAGSQMEAYARGAVLTDRQRRADDSALWRALAAASNYIDTLGGDSKSYRVSLSAQPGAQRTGDSDGQD